MQKVIGVIVHIYNLMSNTGLAIAFDALGVTLFYDG